MKQADRVKKIICLCMCCKDYRNNKGEWGELPEDLKTSDVMVSHGVCPDCLMRVYGRKSVTQNSNSVVM